jgi:hypothetical protein
MGAWAGNEGSVTSEGFVTSEDDELMNAAADQETPQASSYRLRVLVAGLITVEATVLIGAAVVLLVASVMSNPASPVELIALAAIALVVGIGLGLSARGVLSGLRWTRGPVLTWQLLQAGVGMPLSTTGAWWAGVPLLVFAVVVGILIVGRRVITDSGPRF